MSEFQSDPHWALFDKEVAKMRRALGEAVRTKAELAVLKEQLATKDTEIARLREALEKVIDDPDYAVTVVLEALEATP